MKLLMTTDTVGGVWQYTLQLAAALASWDVELVIATMGRPLTPEQRLASQALSNAQFVESCYRLEWMQDPWDDVAAAGEWLLRLARDHDVDLVHLNGYAHATLNWEVPTCVVAHSCVLSWWRAVRGEAAPAEWSRYRTAVGAGLRAASMVIAPSHAMLRALEREHGSVPGARVVYNGRAASDFPSGSCEPFVLSVGRLWDEAKNISAVERVAPALGWPVYIGGDVSPTGLDAAGHPHRSSSVVYMGHLKSDELADRMGRASIYALPALYEPFGLSALEAALAGCALVLGDIPSLRELWNDAAVFVSPRDDDQLRHALDALITAPEWRARVAHACRERALGFDVPRMTSGYLDAYAHLLHSAADGSGVRPQVRHSAAMGWTACAS